jgi:hypothetical protein
MWPLVVLLALGAGAAGAYALLKKEEAPAGEIWGIGLSFVPETASVDTVGRALATAMGWNLSDIIDGAMDRAKDQSPPRGAMFTVAFMKTPRLPTVGFGFKIGEDFTSVTSVTRAPARVGMSAPFFP